MSPAVVNFSQCLVYVIDQDPEVIDAVTQWAAGKNFALYNVRISSVREWIIILPEGAWSTRFLLEFMPRVRAL